MLVNYQQIIGKGSKGWENRERVLLTLAKFNGTANYTEIAITSGIVKDVGSNTNKSSKISGSFNYVISTLLHYGAIKAIGTGVYELTYKLPLCFLFRDDKSKYVYIGLLGLPVESREPETMAALNKLKEQKIEPEEVHIITTEKAHNEWRKSKYYSAIKNATFHELSISVVNNITRFEDDFIKKFASILEGNRLVIMDCTSLTKPATIGMYNIAQRYMIPLIYIYEDTKKLHWIIDERYIKENFGIDNTIFDDIKAARLVKYCTNDKCKENNIEHDITDYVKYNIREKNPRTCNSCKKRLVTRRVVTM